jgi:hypothetical protein
VATTTVHATEATIKVNEADILRLSTLQSFEKVIAPSLASLRCGTSIRVT